MSQRADIEVKDNESKTALHSAAFNGHTEIMELILNHGAQIEARDNKGYTPLHLASAQGQKNSVELLLQKNA